MDRRRAASLVQAAIETDAPLLAVPLQRYATANGLTWGGLASALGCDTDALNRLALRRLPTSSHPGLEIASVAADLGLDAAELDRLMRAALALPTEPALVAEERTDYRTESED